jgi:hypothetical protein
MRNNALVSLVCTFGVAACSFACSSVPPYEATAMALSGTEYSASFYGFSKAWKPIGRDRTYALSDDDILRREFLVGSCVSELTARFVPPPGPALRAIQLLDCMEARGWHLIVEDVIATQ